MDIIQRGRGGQRPANFFGVCFHKILNIMEEGSPWVTQGSFWVTQEFFLGHPGVVLGNPGVIL